MTGDPAAPLREQAQERGRALLERPGWVEIAQRTTVLLVSPPVGIDLPAAPRGAVLWAVAEPSEVRALPQPYRDALVRHGSYVETARLDDGSLELVMLSQPALLRLLEDTTRRALEARWAVRHAQPVHDRLGRLEQYQAVAARLPTEALERTVRPLWLQAVAAVRALNVTPADTALPVAAAGEAAASLARLACVHEEGGHPTADLLLPAARSTRIGRRIATWLDDLGPAAGGDGPAVRRATSGGEQVLREVGTVLAEHFRDRDWLRSPESYALRAR